MAGALDQVLQEQIERALLGLADLDLHAIHVEPLLFADVVVEARLRRRRTVLDLGHEFSSERRKSAWDGGNLAPLAKPRQRPWRCAVGPFRLRGMRQLS